MQYLTPEIIAIGAATLVICYVVILAAERVERAVNDLKTEVSGITNIALSAPWVVAERQRIDRYFGGDE